MRLCAWRLCARSRSYRARWAYPFDPFYPSTPRLLDCCVPYNIITDPILRHVAHALPLRCPDQHPDREGRHRRDLGLERRRGLPVRLLLLPLVERLHQLLHCVQHVPGEFLFGRPTVPPRASPAPPRPSPLPRPLPLGSSSPASPPPYSLTNVASRRPPAPPTDHRQVAGRRMVRLERGPVLNVRRRHLLPDPADSAAHPVAERRLGHGLDLLVLVLGLGLDVGPTHSPPSIREESGGAASQAGEGRATLARTPLGRRLRQLNYRSCIYTLHDTHPLPETDPARWPPIAGLCVSSGTEHRRRPEPPRARGRVGRPPVLLMETHRGEASCLAGPAGQSRRMGGRAVARRRESSPRHSLHVAAHNEKVQDRSMDRSTYRSKGGREAVVVVLSSPTCLLSDAHLAIDPLIKCHRRARII